MRIKTIIPPQMIRPSKEVFLFHLSAGECHEKLTGTCSLDKSLPFKQDAGGEAGVQKCRKLHAQLIEQGIRETVYLGKFRCGHYLIGDGQHRICIAKRKDLILAADVCEEDSDCEYCLKGKGLSEDSKLW